MALGEILGLVIFGSDTENTFKVWGGNLEFHRGAQRVVLLKVGGWFVLIRTVKKKGGF